MQSRVIVFIKDIEAAEAACDVIRKYPVIAFDMEGSNLGRNGNVSLVQIAISQDLIYIFDALVLGFSLFQRKTLLPILSDPTILKLCYDCRSDCATLIHRFRIHPYGFFDLQIVYTYVFQNRDDPYLKGYHKAMQTLGVCLQDDLKSKSLFKKIWRCPSVSRSMLFERPLSEAFVNYCAVDVVYLFKMFETWHISKRFIVKLTYQRVLQFVMQKDDGGKPMSQIDFGKFWVKKS